MGRHGVPIGRILGIPIGLDYSWFLIFAILTWTLARGYYPEEYKDWSQPTYWLTGAATALMLFASVLLHELGHSVVALRYGIPVRSITLYVFGGVARIEAEPPSPSAEFFIAIAGPLVSLALAVLFYVLHPLVADSQALFGLTKYLAYINGALVAFNLIPGYPLDGGRVFRAAVWATTKDMRLATRVAANAGRMFALMLIFMGVWQIFSGNPTGGLWIAFIGWFLDIAASAQLHQMMFKDLLAGHKVSQAMSTDNVSVPDDLTIQALVDEHIFRSGHRSFLVERSGDAVGLITLKRVKDVPRNQWSLTHVADVMLPLERSTSIAAESDLWPALERMDRSGVNQMPVTHGKRIVGMLSREDVITFLRTLQELGVRSA